MKVKQISIGLALLFWAAASYANDFKYDTSTGLCKNLRGEIGYNLPDFSQLLKVSRFEAIVAIVENRDAECVDFGAVDLKIKFSETNPELLPNSVLRLLSWNLRGAQLNKAKLTFAAVEQSNLSGAKFNSSIATYGRLWLMGTASEISPLINRRVNSFSPSCPRRRAEMALFLS